MIFMSSLAMRNCAIRPQATGFYVRDWRQCLDVPVNMRMIDMDLWRHTTTTWHSAPGWSESINQKLPWRVPLQYELARWLQANKGAELILEIA